VRSMIEYGRPEETASDLPIILGCKLTSGRRGVSDTVGSAPQATSSGIASTTRAASSGTGSDSPLLALFWLSDRSVPDPLVSPPYNIQGTGSGRVAGWGPCACPASHQLKLDGRVGADVSRLEGGATFLRAVLQQYQPCSRAIIYVRTMIRT